jgi:hypothetical protein
MPERSDGELRVWARPRSGDGDGDMTEKCPWMGIGSGAADAACGVQATTSSAAMTAKVVRTIVLSSYTLTRFPPAGRC